MKILVTCNVRKSDREDEAEYDQPETIQEIVSALESGRHRVEALDVSGPLSRSIARIEAYRPDLVFNLAEGRRGPYREALIPAVLEDMRVPFTGSDAWTLGLTLDKAMTKVTVAALGVAMPEGRFVRHAEDLGRCGDLRYPVIAKPNFEGSSLGISASSIVETPEALERLVAGPGLLGRFPSGVLVEEYVAGTDVAVPFIEGSLGVLTPFAYEYEALNDGPYKLYDYALKGEGAERVRLLIPAPMPPETMQKVVGMARDIFRHLRVRDIGRIDWRLGDDGRIYFLEVNSLPSLQPDAGLFLAASRSGLDFNGVILSIVEGAVRRYGLVERVEAPKLRTRRDGLTVGFTYNVKRVKPRALDGNTAVTATDDEEAEFDPPATIQAIAEAIAALGHRVIHFEANAELPRAISDAPVDVVFNIAEGREGRNREAQVPALLELLGIPYTGSDVASLAVCLDKALTKRVVSAAGIETPRYQLVASARERLSTALRYPLIVKPTFEGSSKGITARSVVLDDGAAMAVARELLERYHQPVLVEEYIKGREFTVGVVGSRRPRALPPLEVVFIDTGNPLPVYDFAIKQEWDRRVRYDCPAQISTAERTALEVAAKAAFDVLGCRDVARFDFRMDARGVVYFLEANPLPGLTPGFSDLCLIAAAAGMDYEGLIAEILSGAIQRFRERHPEEAPVRSPARVPIRRKARHG